jgi:hypothetical protein
MKSNMMGARIRSPACAIATRTTERENQIVGTLSVVARRTMTYGFRGVFGYDRLGYFRSRNDQ